MRKSNGRRIGHAWRKNDKKKKSNKNEGKEAKTEESDDEKAYQIIVADAADAVSVNFSGGCKFLQI